MYKYTSVADSIISSLLPKIHKHFKEINIEPEQYIGDWFMTVFLKPLPLDIASRVWDIYFLEGEIFLYKVTLGISSFLYPSLCYLASRHSPLSPSPFYLCSFNFRFVALLKMHSHQFETYPRDLCVNLLHKFPKVLLHTFSFSISFL